MIEDAFINYSQIVFSFGVSGYLLVKTTAKLEEISQILTRLCEKLEEEK